MRYGWLIFSLAILATSGVCRSAEISFMCGEGPAHDFELCAKHAQAWASSTGNTVSMRLRPKTTNATLGLLQQFLLAESSEIDVFMIDVIWPGILGPYLLDLRPLIPREEIADHFPSVVATNIGPHGELLAIPFFTDVGLLYYRADLLQKHHIEPPETWDELEDAAAKILLAEHRKNLHGYIWQGDAYEGLTCNALEWLVAFGAGTILDSESGAVSVNNDATIKALTTAANWIGTISPPKVLHLTEAETHQIFVAGNAIFMRNWPYAWSIVDDVTSPVRGKVKILPIPSATPGGKHRGTLGGWSLAISKFSKYPKESASLVRYMTSPQVQLERALVKGFLPTRRSLYTDPLLLAANPMMEKMPAMLSDAVARPASIAGMRYDKLSKKFVGIVRDVLAKRKSAVASVAELEAQLTALFADHHALAAQQ